MNLQTKKAFESTFDISEDFNFADIDLYQSGAFAANSETDKMTFYANLLAKGPVSFIVTYQTFMNRS